MSPPQQTKIHPKNTKIHPGNNVGRGGDDTLFALIDGIVKYERKDKKRKKLKKNRREKVKTNFLLMFLICFPLRSFA